MNKVELIGQYHSLLAPLPVLIFTAVLLCDLLNYFNYRKALIIGHVLVVSAIIICVPTMITGLAAAASMNPENFFLSRHRSLSYATGMFGSLYAGLRIAAMIWKIEIKPLYYVGLSILIVALASWAGDFGSLIVEEKKQIAKDLYTLLP